jgi:D-alanyl-D-alanine dipeptidase
MGSQFDSFTPEDAPFYYDVFHRDNTAVIENRALLRNAMLRAGFTLDADEWWHFDYGNQMWALKSGKDTAIYGEI